MKNKKNIIIVIILSASLGVSSGLTLSFFLRKDQKTPVPVSQPKAPSTPKKAEEDTEEEKKFYFFAQFTEVVIFLLFIVVVFLIIVSYCCDSDIITNKKKRDLFARLRHKDIFHYKVKEIFGCNEVVDDETAKAKDLNHFHRLKNVQGKLFSSDGGCSLLEYVSIFGFLINLAFFFLDLFVFPFFFTLFRFKKKKKDFWDYFQKIIDKKYYCNLDDAGFVLWFYGWILVVRPMVIYFLFRLTALFAISCFPQKLLNIIDSEAVATEEEILEIKRKEREKKE